MIKILLIGFFLLFLLYVIFNFNKTSAKAWLKVFLLGFSVLSIYSIINPGVVDFVAKHLGIGRGADLLLYLLFITFVFISIIFYMKLKELRLRQDKIISRLAITEKKDKK